MVKVRPPWPVGVKMDGGARERDRRGECRRHENGGAVGADSLRSEDGYYIFRVYFIIEYATNAAQ